MTWTYLQSCYTRIHFESSTLLMQLKFKCISMYPKPKSCLDYREPGSQHCWKHNPRRRMRNINMASQLLTCTLQHGHRSTFWPFLFQYKVVAAVSNRPVLQTSSWHEAESCDANLLCFPPKCGSEGEKDCRWRHRRSVTSPKVTFQHPVMYDLITITRLWHFTKLGINGPQWRGCIRNKSSQPPLSSTLRDDEWTQTEEKKERRWLSFEE